MGETERLTVEIISELQAKLDKIEQIVKEWENSKIVTNCYYKYA